MLSQRRIPLRGFCLLVAISVVAGTAQGQESKAESDLPAKQQEESLDVRFARAHLKLARVDLRRAIELNRRYPGTVPIVAIENYRKHVELDEEMLKQATQATDGHVHSIYLRAAQIATEIAEEDLARKRRAWKLSPTKINELNVERAEAALEVARINRLRTESQESSLSSLAYLQWQIEQLRNDLLELRVRVETQHDN